MTFDHFSASSPLSASPLCSPSVSACSPSARTSSAIFTPAAEPVVSPVAQFVAELHGFERQLRSAYAAGGRLQTAAVEAQAAEGMSPVAGHQVLAAITAAQVALSEALSHSAGGHRLIERLGRSLQYDVQAYGEGTKPPEETFRPKGVGLDVVR